MSSKKVITRVKKIDGIDLLLNEKRNASGKLNTDYDY